MSKASSKGTGARTRARELLLQALYQTQIAGHTASELLAQFHQQAAYERVDKDYFDESLAAVCEARDQLEKTIGDFIDRPVSRLDPVELGILLIGTHELESRTDIPYKVIINESINLARRFGSVEGHKYVNACLDAAARSIRTSEVQADDGG